MTKLVSLREEFRHEGLWWLPGSDAEPVAGTLTFAPETGTILTLVGTLVPIEQGLRGGSAPEPRVIHGITKSGKSITLLNCMRKQFQLNMPGIANETYLAGRLLVGIHLDDQAEEIFTCSWSTFDDIADWLGHRPFDLTLASGSRELVVSINAPGEAVLAKAAGIELLGSSSLVTSRNRPGWFSADVESVVGVRPEVPKPLSWHLKQVSRVRALAEICLGRDLQTIGYRLIGPLQDQGTEIERAIEVDFLAQHIEPGRNSAKRSERPLFTLSALLEENPEAYKGWLDLYDLMAPAIDLLLTVLGSKLLLDVKFLLVAQAVEVFDRLSNPRSLEPPTEYEKLKAALASAMPEKSGQEIKDKVVGMLEYANEPNLRQRLKSMLFGLEKDFGKSPLGFDKKLIAAIVDSRNYYTHRSAALGEKTLRGAELYWATQRMILLMIVLLLLRLGVDGAKLKSRLGGHQQFSALLNSIGVPPPDL